MPAEDRIRSRDGSQLVEHLAPEDLTLVGQAPALVTVKEDPLLPELLSEDPILRNEVLDSVLLSAIDLAREDQEQELPRLKRRFHVPPDERLKTAASGIDGPLSSVERGETRACFKSCRYSCLPLG
jgi:hypothetical protein